MIDMKAKRHNYMLWVGRTNMRYLVVLLVGMVGIAHAGQLEVCNNTSADSNTQNSYQPFNSLRGQIALTGTGSAPSVTLPSLRTGMRYLRIDFQNRNDFLYCMDAASPNNWCGTNPPTGTVSNTAWVFKQASVKVLTVSSTMPTTLYVSGTGITGYSMCGMQ